MDIPGDSAGDLRGDRQSESERDSQIGTGSDWQFDLEGDSNRDPKGDMRRGLQGDSREDLQVDFHGGLKGDFEDALLVLALRSPLTQSELVRVGLGGPCPAAVCGSAESGCSPLRRSVALVVSFVRFPADGSLS
jgi:hypothetical protein